MLTKPTDFGLGNTLTLATVIAAGSPGADFRAEGSGVGGGGGEVIAGMIAFVPNAGAWMLALGTGAPMAGAGPSPALALLTWAVSLIFAVPVLLQWASGHASIELHSTDGASSDSYSASG